MKELIQKALDVFHANPVITSVALAILAMYAANAYGGTVISWFANQRLPSIGGGSKAPDTVELVRRWQALLDGCVAAKRPEACKKLHELFPTLQSEE